MCKQITALMVLAMFLCFACSDVTAPTAQDVASSDDAIILAKGGAGEKATGSVDLLWKGGQGNGQSGDKTAAAEFNAHAPNNGNPAKGEFFYRVYNDDQSLHREVEVDVTGVVVEGEKAWFVGIVIADSRGCAGGPGGGHSGGCSGSHSGGCAGGHSGGGGGCGGHDTGHDDACSGDDGGTHDPGCGGPGGSGGHSGGGQGGQGQVCRTGQYLVAKVHDVATPGVNGDGITWKWFDADDPNLPGIDDTANWPHLCKKTITGGNLQVHP